MPFSMIPRPDQFLPSWHCPKTNKEPTATKEGREQPGQVTQWLGMDVFYWSSFHPFLWALEFAHVGVKCVDAVLNSS